MNSSPTRSISPWFSLLCFLMAGAFALVRADSSGSEPSSDRPPFNPFPQLIQEYDSDLDSLERYYELEGTTEHRKRFHSLFDDWLERAEEIDFSNLSQAGKVDYLLFKNQLSFEKRELNHSKSRLKEIRTWVPFTQSIAKLNRQRRDVLPIHPRKSADQLAAISESVRSIHQELAKARKENSGSQATLPSPILAKRTADRVEELRRALRDWQEFFSGYHPEATWWTKEPFEEANRELDRYASFLREEIAGYKEGEDPPVLGDPIGRAALLDALVYEMIHYTPEQLIEIAEQEFEWCEREMLRASRDLGFGDDWRKALDHVKNLHVDPGEQPQLIKKLAQEAIDFLEDRQLLTIPPLSKEIWRMRMMPPERQKVNPYFTGGEVISVSFPTDSMSHPEKIMSLRGNNIHFCRATVHHELIPGHHLQGFMAERHRPYRRIFRTPFFVEGWALYWEMLLWDLEFPQSAEDRVGFLFWRSHRCARIIFSLKFHLGEMTAQEAIDFLIERVGHEPRNATAEVRRSVMGGYDPLYQAAYMLGGLQLRALHKELVKGGEMSNREFHDAVLRENLIPIAMIRASLTGIPLTKDYPSRWDFYGLTKDEDSEIEKQENEQEEVEQDHDARAQTDDAAVYRNSIHPHWFDDNNQFWYRVETGPGQFRFIRVNAVSGKREPAFNHEVAAEKLSEEAGRELDPAKLPFERIAFTDDLQSVKFLGEDESWLFGLSDHRLSRRKTQEEKDPDQEQEQERENRRRSRGGDRDDSQVSPDGRWKAFAHGHNLHIREQETGREWPLTFDGNPGHTYARDILWDRAVGMRYNRSEPSPEEADVTWSPDSKYLVVMRTRTVPQRTVHLVNSSPDDQLQPKLESYPYLKPGDEIPLRTPHLFDVENRKKIPISNDLFPNPWSIDRLDWMEVEEGSSFTFRYNQRGHQLLRIIEVEAGTGNTRTLVEEKSDTFIDYAHKYFYRRLPESSEILWMSERDGWNHLYLLDAASGSAKNQITQGAWVVRGVEHVDPDKRHVFFRAGGIHPDQDPYFVHYARIDFDGSDLTLLTQGNGTHSVEFSPDRRFYIDQWSRVDQPPVHELRRTEDGGLVCILEEADAEALYAAGWKPPERFSSKGRDGKTDIYGIVHRPRTFDPNKKYPVIESIYAGPHGAHVPKRFRTRYSQQELANHGFIVVRIDGMGTSHRSKAFHDVCWKNLGDAGFPDRILWMKALAEEYDYVDLDHVGIYGGSAGGQNAMRALISHGDFYKAAAADCGCHDNRMDKIWWNELWMGWPVGPHYAEQSNVTQAHRLKGKLLLTLGELDRNVDPSSTLQVVDALIEADKDFDLIIFPGRGHGAGGSPYGRRRRAQFFEEALR